MNDFDVHADVRDPILKARAIVEMVRLAAQSDGDELRPATVYETMLAVEDLLDTALTGLAPLIQSVIADNEHTHIGRRSPDRYGRH